MEYICKNPECPDYGKKEYFSSETFFYQNGKMVGKHAVCPKCQKTREEINPNEDVPLSQKSIGINFYNGMSMDQKREVLKKRSHAHFNKEIRERKEGMLHQAVTEFREMNKR